MDPLEMEKNAICSSLRAELKNLQALMASRSDCGPLRTSCLKIQAYCDRLDEIDRIEKGGEAGVP